MKTGIKLYVYPENGTAEKVFDNLFLLRQNECMVLYGFPQEKQTASSHMAGFTLADLLISISIITILIIATMVGGINVLNRSRADAIAQQIQEIKQGATLYYLDTHTFPPSLSVGNAANPAFNGLTTQPAGGVDGWNGPYAEQNMVAEHHYGGAIRFVNEADTVDHDDDNTINDFFIVLDDDAPGTSSGDDSGIIPGNILILIDEALDDGNLSSGEVRGNGCNAGTQFFNSACNELMIRVSLAGI